MTWLAFVFSLEIGLVPNIGVLQYVPYQYDFREWSIGYTQLDATVELWDFVFVGGGMRTYITPTPGEVFNFSPNTTVFDFRAGLRWKMLELGWRHRCFHPTLAYLPVLDLEVTGMEGSYDEVYLRVSGKVDGRK